MPVVHARQRPRARSLDRRSVNWTIEVVATDSATCQILVIC
jgi:hypothetical protein